MKKHKLISIGLVICVIMAAFAIVPGTIAENAYAQESEVFDPELARETLLSSNSEEELHDYLESLNDEQRDAVVNILTEDDIRGLAARLDIDLNEVIFTPAQNYTEVGPLMPPVDTTPTLFRMLRSAPVAENGLILEKSAEFDATTNKATISIEAYTTGTVSSTSQAVPTDIVLVLDESGSMADAMYSYSEVYELSTNQTYYIKQNDSYVQVSYCGGGLFGGCDAWCTGFHFFIHFGNQYEPMTSATDTTEGHVQFYTRSETSISKQDALKNTASAFVRDVYDEAVANNVDHRVSVVGFSGNGNSTVKIGLEDDIRNNIGTAESANTVLYAIDNLNANGGTYIEDGLANAESVFADATPTTATKRNRVVVIFTDGIPGSGSWGSSTISDSADPAIATSYTLKNTYKATVYSIGMLDDANPEVEISDSTDDSARTNKFLHYLSSNYPEAQSMSNGGENYNHNGGYYLSASDTESLNIIFEKISGEISTPSIELDESTVIKDIVSPYFNMPENTSDIKVTTVDCESYNEETGAVTWKETESIVSDAVTLNSADNSLNVTGFNFNDNFVSANAKNNTAGTANEDHGKKLVIEFTVDLKDGFLGGNGVPTNGTTSGVYKGDELVELLPYPTVDVPIKDVTVAAENKNVYLQGSLTESDMTVGATATSGGVVLDLDADNYGLESWQNAYVDIDFGDTSALTNLTNDTEYTLTVDIAPLEDGTYNAKSDSDTKNVNVFKPVITFRDSTINLGDSADYDVDNGGSVVWKHGNTTAVPANMTGNAPALVYGYTPAEDAFKVDTNVKVSVSIGGTDVTSHVTFYREACTFDGCDWKESEVVTGSKPNFVVHINNFDLKITKAGILEKHENQSCIFKVEGPNDFEMDVVLVGNETVTIKNVPAGIYTITEQNDWTWRYEELASQTVGTANVVDGVATVIFNNNHLTTYWLSGDNFANNLFRAGENGKFGIDVTAQNGAD